jgi:hypothetical protein
MPKPRRSNGLDLNSVADLVGCQPQNRTHVPGNEVTKLWLVLAPRLSIITVIDCNAP